MVALADSRLHRQSESCGWTSGALVILAHQFPACVWFLLISLCWRTSCASNPHRGDGASGALAQYRNLQNAVPDQFYAGRIANRPQGGRGSGAVPRVQVPSCCDLFIALEPACPLLAPGCGMCAAGAVPQVAGSPTNDTLRGTDMANSVKGSIDGMGGGVAWTLGTWGGLTLKSWGSGGGGGNTQLDGEEKTVHSNQIAGIGALTNVKQTQAQPRAALQIPS